MTKIDDSRLIEQARAYWERCRGARAMPARADIEPGAMVAFLTNVVLIDVLRDPLDFRYRLIGTEVENHSAERHTGRRISEIPGRAPPSSVWDNLAAVAERGKPSDRSVPYVGPLKDFVRTRQVTLPLSADGATVDKLLIVIEYLRASAAATP